MIVNICDCFTYTSLKDVIRTDLFTFNVNTMRIKTTVIKFVKQGLVNVDCNDKNNKMLK
jgi:hypothetical protein